MSGNYTKAIALLNSIAGTIPLVEKSDLASMSTILGHLDELTKDEDLPKAFTSMVTRAAQLTGHIIMSETPFDTGLGKLVSSIEKMQKGLEAIADAANNAESADIEPTKTTKNSPRKVAPKETAKNEASDELQELVIKFGASQAAVLEDFEAFILEFEKGHPQAKAALKRILHTWKGEFGVLDLGDFSALIHEVEERIEENRCGADMLFKVKDLLAGKIAACMRGQKIALTQSERQEVLALEKIEAPKNSSPMSIAPQVTPPVVLTSGDNAFAGDPSLMGDFVNESRDHTHAAETLLLELENDPTHAENLNTIFRAWHTIKGVAGFLGLKEVNALAHSMENTMDLARKGELILGPAHIDVLLEGNDCLKGFIASAEKTISGEPFLVPENYTALMERLAMPAAISSLSADSSLQSRKKMGEILIEQGIAPQAIANAIQTQKSGDERKLGQILIDESNVPARAVAQALATQNAGKVASALEETIRVPINRIDQLVDAIGEAVIAQSMVSADPAIKGMVDQTLNTKIAHANMIMRQIQELAMSLRMVSLKSTFQKMARLARDLSKKSGKEVEFVTEGEDTELDKSVVENIGDPLIHMIRNSIDHGIETAEQREKTTKPAKARVTLRAYQKAGNIYLEIQDDGRGLNKDAIFQKAVDKNLCKPDDHFTDQELFQFIFLPGFSTAKTITDVSGRGVGMDVVRKNIESLRGSCEIASVSGVGTTFTIRLPLTMAIVDGMIVRSGTEHLIIPTLAILESIKPEAGMIESVMNRGKMIKVRGDLINLVHLESLLMGKGAYAGHEFSREGVVMIVEDMLGKKIGLYLDEILGQQQVVIKNLGEGMGDIPGVSGGAIMSDGNVSLILDISGVVKMAGG